MAAEVSVVEPVSAARTQRAQAGGASWVLLALIGVIGLACGLSPLVGGFYSLTTWGPIALGTLAVTWGLLLAGHRAPGRLALVALIALVVLAVLSVLSVTWAESADNSLVGASRWILYASTFAILIGAIRTEVAARVGIAAATVGIAVVAAYVLAVMFAGDGPSLFLGARLNDPLGYVNSEGLFFLLGFWPLVGVAQYARPVVAGIAAAGASTLAAIAFLSQSRSVILAFVVPALAVLLLVPGRHGRVWLLLLLVAGVAAISAPLIDVYDLGNLHDPGFEDAIRSAVGWIVLAAAVVGVVWAGVVAAERRFATPAWKRASAVTLGALALVGVGVLGVRADSIRTYTRDQVTAFTTLHQAVGRARFLSGGGYRYDFWRIAVREFRDHPVGGVGADNYTRDYFARRQTIEDVRQPHSVGFQTLAELGLLGAIAYGVFLAAVAAGAVLQVRTRRLAPPERALLVATTGAFSAWLAHSSVDWSHLLPGTTGIALLAAAYLVSRPEAPAPAVVASRRRVPAIAVAVLASLGILIGAITVERTYLADHYLEQGKRSLRTQPVRAIKKANDSLAFNGDSLQALFLKSAGYARLGDYQRSRAALLDATKLEPHNFLSWSLLGDLEVRRGRLGAARASYARASRLNPQDRTLRRLAREPRP
jgi:hypothetical protein